MYFSSPTTRRSLNQLAHTGHSEPRVSNCKADEAQLQQYPWHGVSNAKLLSKWEPMGLAVCKRHVQVRNTLL